MRNAPARLLRFHDKFSEFALNGLVVQTWGMFVSVGPADRGFGQHTLQTRYLLLSEFCPVLSVYIVGRRHWLGWTDRIVRTPLARCRELPGS